MTKITLRLQDSVQAESELEQSASIDRAVPDNEELDNGKPTGISIKIIQKEVLSDEESKLGCTTGVKGNSVLGKRAVRKWEKRWVLQPNVFDLNEGEIWVQKWVHADKAQTDQ